MRINHNISALNTYSQLVNNQGAASKSIEKLSSGFRINRAGDDAAGLAISEKMRGQIRGLDMAAKNSQDAISMIQTAEGGLNETQSILQRMRELAVQSANDTNTADDRKKIQAEVDLLAKEITRISNTTEFNTQNLLGGGLKDTFHIGANQGQNITLSINAMDAKSLGVAGDLVSSAFSGANNTGTNVVSASPDMARTSGANGLTGYKVVTTNGQASKVSGANVMTSNGQGFSASVGTVKSASEVGVSGGYTGAVDKTFIVKINTLSGAGTGNAKITSASYSVDGGTTWTSASISGSVATLSDNVKITFSAGSAGVSGAKVGDTFTFTATAAYKTAQLFVSGANGAQAIGNQVKIYSNMTSVTIGDASYQGTDPTKPIGKVVTLDFNFKNVTAGSGQINQYKTESTAAKLATDGSIVAQAVTQKGIDVSSQDAASKAITVIENALRKVSEERSKLGAYQNRLEHTINNLGTSSENLTAAESRIRDVDMAKEMMNFTKNNVLTQAAQSMLAQANQQPQGVLGLLR